MLPNILCIFMKVKDTWNCFLDLICVLLKMQYNLLNVDYFQLFRCKDDKC